MVVVAGVGIAAMARHGGLSAGDEQEARYVVVDGWTGNLPCRNFMLAYISIGTLRCEAEIRRACHAVNGFVW
jgi:hypothetical protein